MEDTKSLLMMVLHKIFQNQPKIIENMFQLIHSFNNGKIEKKNYEKTLKSICDLMNDELPSPILVYILTLVDMPQNFDSTSPIIEKMKKTHDFLPEMNVRPHLLEYLNNMKPSQYSFKSRKVEVEIKENTRIPEVSAADCKNSNDRENKDALCFLKPTKIAKRTPRKHFSKITGSPKRLLDICAVYVVANENVLKEMYKKKQVLAWRLINSNVCCGTKLSQCYDAVKDLNKKTKWLREIESENISMEVFTDEYKMSEVFVKENHLLRKNPFALSPQSEKTIDALFGDQ